MHHHGHVLGWRPSWRRNGALLDCNALRAVARIVAAAAGLPAVARKLDYPRPERSAAMATTVLRSCNLCEAGCGLAFEVEGNRILSVRPDETDPISYAPSLAKEIETEYGKSALEGLQKVGFKFEEPATS